MKNNNTLKDGDKLICIDPYEPLIFGKEYVFKGYYDNDEEARLISLYDFNQPFFEHRFNKVEEKPTMELKDGDKLVCVKSDPTNKIFKGIEYTFKKYYNDVRDNNALVCLYEFSDDYKAFFEYRFNKVENKKEKPIMELKDGDKLVCVKPRLDMKKGDIYTFKEKVKDEIDFIYVYEYPTSCFASRFEKLEENKIQKKREEFIILCGEYKLEGRYDCMDDCLQYLYTLSPLDVEIYKKVANVKTETKCKVEVV